MVIFMFELHIASFIERNKTYSTGSLAVMDETVDEINSHTRESIRVIEG